MGLRIIIIFNTNHLSHRMYYKVIDIVRSLEIQIGYVSSTNIDLSKQEIIDIVIDQ